MASSFLDRLRGKRAVRFWRNLARDAAKLPLSALRVQRGAAHMLRSHLDTFIYVAENRLALPLIGSQSFPRPRNSDWAWRPEMWRGPLARVSQAAALSKTRLGNEITLFHDCQISELTLRQVRNTRERDLAPYGLRMDVFQFDGSFLSLAIDCPPEAVKDLRKNSLIRMNAIVEHEKPLEIFARLNVQHGPNSETVLRELPLGAEDIWVEFDLHYTELNEKRVERMWVDIIFEGPEMNQITLRDITFSRAPRAEL